MVRPAPVVRPGPNVVRPAPVLPTPVPVPVPPAGQASGGQGDQVIWDLAAEEKARIRAAAKATGKTSPISNIRR